MTKLSIIIPIYNVDQYVEYCIRSLEEQDIPKEDFELICVNDGSPDKSRNIIESLQTEFCNIVLINQENQGVSKARNNGIEIANGKYLLFIDPDDYVESNCFNRILNIAEQNCVQVLFLGYTLLNLDGSIRKSILNSKEVGHSFSGIEAYYLTHKSERIDPDRMWAILFEREFINNKKLRYLANVPYLEDGELIARILCLAERCIFDGHSFYQRTLRLGSATNSTLFHSQQAINGFILAAQNLKSFQKAHELNSKQLDFLNQPICKFVLLAVNASFGREVKFMLFQTIKVLKDNDLIKLQLKGCRRHYKWCGKAYNLSPFLGALAMMLWFRIIDPQ